MAKNKARADEIPPAVATGTAAPFAPGIRIGDKLIPVDPGNGDYIKLCADVKAGVVPKPQGLVLPD